MHASTHHVVQVNEGVVDGNDVDLLMRNGVSEDDSSNATEAVDADTGGSHVYVGCEGGGGVVGDMCAV